MPAYTDGTEVYELLLDFDVGPPTRLSTSEVDTLVEGFEAEVDGILLGQGYTVPATGTRDKAMIREKVRMKTAARVYDLLYSKDRSPDWARNAHIDWSDWLNMLRQGQLRLVDQAPTAAEANEVVVDWMRVLPELPDEEDYA